MGQKIDLNKKREQQPVVRTHRISYQINTTYELENQNNTSQPETNNNDDVSSNQNNNKNDNNQNNNNQNNNNLDNNNLDNNNQNNESTGNSQPSPESNINNQSQDENKKRPKNNDNRKKISKDASDKIVHNIKQFFKNPVTIQAIMFIIPILILIFIVMYVLVAIYGSEYFEGKYIGIGGYPYYSEHCTQVKYNDKMMSIEEYVQRVIAIEVKDFSIETLKTFAIAARTYVMQTGEKVGDDPTSCYYDATNILQGYSEDYDNELYAKAVNETRGLIITVNGNLNSHYDASCVYTATQAAAIETNNTYDENYYYIRYGELTIGGINFQEIPKSEADIGTLLYYADKSETNGACAGNNGYGMSQNGAAYLEKNKGYTWEDIIDYYYHEKQEIMSIYKSFGYTGDFPLEPNNELYSNLQFLINTSFSDYLTNKGSSIEEYNAYLQSEIEEAGIGTREGVVSAAVTLIGSLAEQGIKLNYQWAGKHKYIGVKPTWGTEIDTWYCGPESYGALYDSSKCYKNYKWSSFDCSGFVTWAVINGMQDETITQSDILYAPSIKLNSDIAVCKPGGALNGPGHIVLVVGLDEENKRYIVAESTGSNVNTNIGGVKLSYYSYGAKNYECSNLDEIYGE